jgi:hypothetical protein
MPAVADVPAHLTTAAEGGQEPKWDQRFKFVNVQLGAVVEIKVRASSGPRPRRRRPASRPCPPSSAPTSTALMPGCAAGVRQERDHERHSDWHLALRAPGPQGGGGMARHRRPRRTALTTPRPCRVAGGAAHRRQPDGALDWPRRQAWRGLADDPAEAQHRPPAAAHGAGSSATAHRASDASRLPAAHGPQVQPANCCRGNRAASGRCDGCAAANGAKAAGGHWARRRRCCNHVLPRLPDCCRHQTGRSDTCSAHTLPAVQPQPLGPHGGARPRHQLALHLLQGQAGRGGLRGGARLACSVQ